MSNFGIKTVKGSANVITAKDIELGMSSSFTSFKILKSGEIAVTTDGSGNGTASIIHALGFTPTFQVFRMGTASWQHSLTGVDSSTYSGAFFPNPRNHHSWINNHINTEFYVDKNNLYVQAISAGASTTYYFKYYIFADLAQFYSGNTINIQSQAGLKSSKPDKGVIDSKNYDMSFSSGYKIPQYYQESCGQFNFTLPAMSASPITDPNPESASYVDIFHNLGYPPFFMAFWVSPAFTDTWSELPDYTLNGLDAAEDIISSWCDNTRVRLSWYRRGDYNFGTASFAQQTAQFKWVIFNEDLRL